MRESNTRSNSRHRHSVQNFDSLDPEENGPDIEYENDFPAHVEPAFEEIQPIMIEEVRKLTEPSKKVNWKY